MNSGRIEARISMLGPSHMCDSKFSKKKDFKIH